MAGAGMLWRGLLGVSRGRQWGFMPALFPFVAALLPLAKDTDPSVSCLATQTVFILSSEVPTARWSLRSLRCWPCQALQR